MVESKVPDGRIDHSVGGDGHDGSDDGASDDVVPIVIFVDSKSARDEGCTEEGGIEGDELPHCGMVVGEDFEFGVEVEIEEEEAGPLVR